MCASVDIPVLIITALARTHHCGLNSRIFASRTYAVAAPEGQQSNNRKSPMVSTAAAAGTDSTAGTHTDLEQPYTASH